MLSEYVRADGGRLAPRPAEEQRNIVNRGVDIFRSLFGRGPRATVAPHYLWDGATECAWRDAGIRVVQAVNRHLRARSPFGFLRVPRFSTGRRSPAGLLYLARNCRFEPVLYGDTAEKTFRQVRMAFETHRAAIISSHRINFSGRLFPERRDRTLWQLGALLDMIVDRYPETEFLTSAALAQRILREECRSSLSGARVAASRALFLCRRAAGMHGKGIA